MDNLDEEKYVGVVVKSKRPDKYAMVGRSSDEDFDSLADDVAVKLNIHKDDVVLDFACGNGEITARIAKRCKLIIGIDFSRYLIDYARKNNNGSNIDYILADNRNFIHRLKLKYPKITFNRIFSNAGAGQYLSLTELIAFVNDCQKILKLRGKILFADTLLGRHRYRLYNTMKKKLIYFTKKYILHTYRTGYWRDINELFTEFDKAGYSIELLRNLPHNHYRFDFIVSRGNHVD